MSVASPTARFAAALLTAAFLAGLPLSASVASAVDPEPITGAFIDGEDTWLVEDRALSFRAPGGFVFVQPYGENGITDGITIIVNGLPVWATESESWYITLAPVLGSALGPGVYEDAHNSRDATRQPLLRVTGDGKGCNQSAGRFVIHELVRDVGGAITTLAVDIEHNCDEDPNPAHLEIRLASAVPLRATAYRPERIDLGEVDLGEPGTPVSVEVRNTGSVEQVIEPRLDGPHASDFRIVTDGCSGVTLGPGDSCSVDVRFQPGSRGERTADLLLGDGTERGYREIDLIGLGLGPTTTVLDVASTSTYPSGFTLRATVDPAPGVGWVIFRADGRIVATFPMWHTATGVAETFVSLAPGAHDLVAEYVGAAPFQSSTSAARAHAATRGTRTTLTSSPASVGAGESVRLFATVDAAGPGRPVGGTLSIKDETTGTTLAVTPVTATVTELRATAPAASGHTISATYSGTSDLASSSTQVVFSVADAVAPTATIQLAYGSAGIGEVTVPLRVTPADPAPSSGIDAMRFSEDGVTWTAWELYAFERSWTFSGADGVKTLYVQIRDAAQNVSAAASDTIFLDRVAPSAALALASGAPAVAYTSVPWTISASDPSPSSGLALIRFRDSQRTWWSEWLTFTSSGTHLWTALDIPWTLEVQVMDRGGNISDVASDTVTFDDDPPQASVTLAAGASATRSLTVPYALGATDAGIGATHVRLAADAGAWGSWVPLNGGGTWTFSSADGSRTLHAQVRDAAGNVSAKATDAIIIDRTAPAPRSPAAAFLSGATLTNGRLPVRIGFSTTDAGSGIGTYRLDQEVSGSYVGVPIPAGVTSVTRTLTADGRAYRFRTRATDKVGNTNAWREGTMAIRRYENTSAALRFSGSWRTRSSSTYSGGSTRSSSTVGSSVRLSFTGKSIALVAPTGPDRGRMAVELDGRRIGTVDLYAATKSVRRVVFTARFGAGSHSVRLRVIEPSGASAGRRVDVDAIVVLR